MRRVYIAARYGRRIEALAVRAYLENAGHQVTAEWTLGHHDNIDDESAARFDIRDIDACDTVVSLTEEPGSGAQGRARGGRHVEFGYALAKGKRVIVLGPRENVFHHLPDVEQVRSVPELLELLS